MCAGFTNGSSQTCTGPNSSCSVTGASAPSYTGEMWMPQLSMTRPPKASRSGESWLPLMSSTGTPRVRSSVRKPSSSSTASTDGTDLSYTSPAMSTPSGCSSSRMARICRRMCA